MPEKAIAIAILVLIIILIDLLRPPPGRRA